MHQRFEPLCGCQKIFFDTLFNNFFKTCESLTVIAYATRSPLDNTGCGDASFKEKGILIDPLMSRIPDYRPDRLKHLIP